MSSRHPPTRSPSQLVEHVRALVERAPLPMLATHGPAHLVWYVNPALRVLVGQTCETMIGSPLGAPAANTSQTRSEGDLALLDEVYSTGTPEVMVDLAGVSAQLKAVPLPCSVWPILDDDDRPRGLLIQVSAPTSTLAVQHVDRAAADELVVVNERLLVAGLKAQEQAEVQLTLRSQAEAALTIRDEFISIAAHELRTPVTGIKTSAQLALRTFEDATPSCEQNRRYLRGIVDGANRLVLLINDLMDVSRMRSGELLLRLQPIDVGALVATIALRYTESGGERHQVTTELPPAPLVIPGDAGRLEQVLDNLLSNAFKYSPSGGTIGVCLAGTSDGVVLTVSDTGIGLSPGAHERIFEPFGRAANAKLQGLPGMGLGLHICRRIVEAHGGRMWAESAGEGHGMTVGVWLPQRS